MKVFQTPFPPAVRAGLLLCALLLLASVRPASGQLYKVHPIPDFELYGFNNSGQAVGRLKGQAALFQGAGQPVMLLDALGYPFSEARGISDNGLIVGDAWGTDHASRPILWTGGVPADISSWRPELFWFMSINNAGDAVGYQDDRFHLCLYRNDNWLDIQPTPDASIMDLTRLNNAGQVAGNYYAPDGRNLLAFFYDGNALQPIPELLPGGQTIPTGINDDGAVVGGWGWWFGTPLRAFYYHDGVTTDLGAYKNQWTHAVGINNLGRIVGQARTESGLKMLHFAYDLSKGRMVDLDAAILPGYDLTHAWLLGINDRGEIFGYSGPTSNTFILRPVEVETFTVSPNPITGGENVDAEITLKEPAPAGGVTLRLAGAPGVTVPPTSVSIPAGERSVAFTVGTLVVRSRMESYVTMKSGLYPVVAPLTVLSLTPQSLAISPGAVSGGTSTTAKLTLGAPAGQAGLDVTLTSSAPDVAWPQDYTLHFAPGESVKDFGVLTAPVTATTSVRITASANGRSVKASVTVKAPVLAGLTLVPSTVVGGGSALGTVTMSGPVAVDTVVQLTSANPRALLPNGTNTDTVTVPKGAASQTFTVTTQPAVMTVRGKVSATVGGLTKGVTVLVTP